MTWIKEDILKKYVSVYACAKQKKLSIPLVSYYCRIEPYKMTYKVICKVCEILDISYQDFIDNTYAP